MWGWCCIFKIAFILEDEDILELLKTTLHSPKGLGKENIQIEESILKQLAAFANGDARVALNTLEMCVLNAENTDGVQIVNEEVLAQCISQKSLLYDKKEKNIII